MDKEYVLVYTPYITRKGVRIWASQYGLKVFCLRIPSRKVSRLIDDQDSNSGIESWFFL